MSTKKKMTEKVEVGEKVDGSVGKAVVVVGDAAGREVVEGEGFADRSDGGSSLVVEEREGGRVAIAVEEGEAKKKKLKGVVEKEA